MRLNPLREQRANIIDAANKLISQENLTKEDAEKFDAMMAEADALRDQIARIERAEKAAAEISARNDQTARERGVSTDQLLDEKARQSAVFNKWLKAGISGLDDEERKIAQVNMGQIPGLRAAQSVGTPSAGGYTVPQEFLEQLETAMKAYGGMRSVATIIRTDSGADMPFPSANDTAQTGAILSENSQIAAQDVTFGSVTLKSYVYTSKLILVSLQLLNDSTFDLGSWLAARCAERLGRAENAHFTTGSGSGQPNGVMTAAPTGRTAATGQTTSITSIDELFETQHAVDPAYRAASVWMMNDASLKIIRKLKDSQNRPLWTPDLRSGGDDTLLGSRVVINQDTATMAANAYSIAYGDFSKYYIRDVVGVQMLQLRERYADYLQVGFFAFQRTDGNLMDAGTNPIVRFRNSAT